MAGNTYIGIANVARKTKNMYVGVGGVARKVKKAYIGVNGVARQFYSASNITFGSAITGYYKYINMEQVSGDFYIGSYQNTNSYLCVRMFRRSSGKFISYGSEVVVQTSAIASTAKMAVLDANNVLMAYNDPLNNNYTYLVVLSVSGTWTITVNTPKQYINNDDKSVTDIFAMTSTTAAFFYRDDSGYVGFGVVVTVSGTTITTGTAVQFLSNYWRYVSMAQIDASTFIAIISNPNASGTIYGVILTASTTVYCGTKYTVSTVGGRYSVVGVFNSTLATCVHMDSSGNYLYAVALTISAYNITNGGAIQGAFYGVGAPTDIHILNSDCAVYTFKTNSGNGYAPAIGAVSSGGNIGMAVIVPSGSPIVTGDSLSDIISVRKNATTVDIIGYTDTTSYNIVSVEYDSLGNDLVIPNEV